MVTKIVEQKEIEIGGKKVIINLLKINKENKFGDIIYFRIVGHFLGHTQENSILKELREKYKDE